MTPVVDTYFHQYSREIDLTTSEYDGTYGAHNGTFSVRQCIVCAALVDSREIQRHADWHEAVVR